MTDQPIPAWLREDAEKEARGSYWGVFPDAGACCRADSLCESCQILAERFAAFALRASERLAKEAREDTKQAARILREWAGDRQKASGKWTMREQAAVECAIRLETAVIEQRELPDLVTHLERQRAFSARTFGPGQRTAGVLDHIRKELREIEADPSDLSEWIDVVILAFDGAWRAGHEPEEIAAALVNKQRRNEAREWPDWRTADPNKAIEHTRAAARGEDRPR